MNRVKVLQLISSGGYYGAENMLLNLCASQQKAGCENSLMLFYNVHAPNVEFYERARRCGLSVRMVHCQGRADWRAVRQIEECIQEDGIELLHTHGYKADLYGYVAARRSGKPIVATCHNWVGGTAALGIYNHLARQHSDMPAIYAAMDIFVLPSLNEGLPMTILEAMAASKPVIATRVGAIPSVIKDGETGLLVNPEDVNGLRNALARLLTDSDLCRRI